MPNIIGRNVSIPSNIFDPLDMLYIFHKANKKTEFPAIFGYRFHKSNKKGSPGFTRTARKMLNLY